MAILSFIGCVNIAVRIVTEKYPEAKLYEVDGVSSSGLTTDPLKIDELTVVFVNVADGSTVIIRSTGWGEFGEPESNPEPWTEDVIIQWPVNMDLVEANLLKEAAGYKASYLTVTLRNPMGPVIGNPCYIFSGDSNSSHVVVDTVTQKVHAEQ